MNEIRKAGKCRSIDFFVLEYNKKRHKEVQTSMLKWLLTGGLIPPILLAAGAFFLFYLRGYPWRAPRRMLSAFVGEKKGEGTSSFRAMMLALAGTLGVGNIVGVANAIAIGGAGAVFWMWISALFAMILKYAEILLAVSHRRTDQDGNRFGGAMYYIRDCFESRRWQRLAIVIPAIFAFLMVTNALSIGCMVQVRAVGETLDEVVGIPTVYSGVLLVLLTLPLLARGIKGISALTEYLVPIMTAGYVILSVAVLILRRDALGDAMRSIWQGAFTPEGAIGGVSGFLLSRALRVGTMRGLLSNEGGCGTAPTAHAEANAKSPAHQGVWGIFEVFVDTILLCTATALVILVSGVELSSGGVMMTVTAYSSVLGGFADWFFCAAVFCFGYATLLCWGSYGMESVKFLSKKRRWRVVYVLAFGAAILLGVRTAPEFVWNIGDFGIATMTVINLFALFLLRKEIWQETRLFVQEGKKREGSPI
ncbi:MAG: sodium:alanine symporter family protein [Ruminococcaceae bacterium]|nr:sodium:alanine symporter family protein [Oscillospiraceae bacterium]